MCSLWERDVTFGNDASFGRDVCLRQVLEHITSLCGLSAIHHGANPCITCPQGILHYKPNHPTDLYWSARWFFSHIDSISFILLSIFLILISIII